MEIICLCTGFYAGVNLSKNKKIKVSKEVGEHLIELNKAKAAKLPKEGFIKLTEKKDAKSSVQEG